jgi:hypothetical protein
MGKAKKPDPAGDAATPAGKAKVRASPKEVADRIAEILRIRLDGAAFHDCVEFAKEKGWDVSERQVGRYIREADDLLVERQDTSRKRVIARHLAQREALVARCINAADYRTALAVLADLAKLRGLYPEKDAKELIRLATEQAARIAELEKQLRALGPHPPSTPPERPETGGPGGAGAG